MKKPNEPVGNPYPAALPMLLTDRERKLVSRLQQVEKRRWLYNIPGIIAGAFFVLIYWEAPFAYWNFTSLPHVDMQKIPHSEAVYTVMWLAGLVLLISGIRGLFFDRERKLLLRITSELYEADGKKFEQTD